MLTDVYKPVINGVTNSISLCKRVMEDLGHQVNVFTFGSQDTVDDEKDVICSPAIPISDTGYHFSISYSRKARLMLGEMDVLHAHHPFISGRIAARHGRHLNLPVVFTNHTRYDLYAHSFFPLISPALASVALETYMPSFTALCDLVIAPSLGIKQLLEELGVKTNISLVPNGIDLERIYRPRRIVARTELGIPEESLVLLYCGRIGREKNLAFLLKAFQAAVQAVPNAYLILIGSGSMETELRKQAGHSDHVFFVGQVSYQEVPSFLAVGDVFVTASVTEVHPLSVIEALAAGLPVLGIESPGISDTVRQGIDGFLVEHDLAAYSAMMVRLLLDRDLRIEISENARARSSEFDIKITATKLISHYERLIGERYRRSNQGVL